MIGSYSDRASTVRDICNFRALCFDSIYSVITDYFYPGLWKAPFSLKVWECESFKGLFENISARRFHGWPEAKLPSKDACL